MWKGFLWSIGLLVGVLAVAYPVRIAIFVCKRVRLWITVRRLGAAVRPLRPLWWLMDIRRACDLLVELPALNGDVPACTLAVKLIPTVMPGVEYSISDRAHFDRKLNFLVPFSHGTLMMDFGYRHCLPRHTRFDRYPDAVPTYLFHPHPFAITLGHRGTGRGRARGVEPVSVPVWVDGVLLLDAATLRELPTMSPEARATWMAGRYETAGCAEGSS